MSPAWAALTHSSTGRGATNLTKRVAYYNRLGSPLPSFWGALLEEVESALLLDSKALAAHFRLYCQPYDLKKQMSDVV